jgi:hypothetical protein
LNRLELIGETLRAALNELATVAPEWLQSWVPGEWFERYGRLVDEYRLPKGIEARQAYAQRVGSDGITLLVTSNSKFRTILRRSSDRPNYQKLLSSLGVRLSEPSNFEFGIAGS